MKHTRFVALTLLFLVLSACTPIVQPSFQTLQPEVVPSFTETAQLPETGNAPASTPFTDVCPIPTANLQLFADAVNGYCLLYPAGNTTVIPPYLIVVNPNGMPGDVPGDAWAQMRVEPASGRTAAQVADTWIAEAGEGFNITRSEIVVDGKQAVVVDGLPGPDPWRLVFIDGPDHIYTLFFLPWLPNADYFPQLEKLYTTVIGTFRALPSTTSTSSLPDLTITSAYVSMVDGTGVCLSYYGLIVTVVNQGGAPAPDVILAENNMGQQVGIGTINAGQSITMSFVAKAPNGAYAVMVDPQNAIAETNEANNSAAFAGPTATPPAFCLPAQIGTSTSTPSAPPTGAAREPGWLARGRVTINGAGLAGVSIYRKYSAYPEVLIATTDGEGYYQSDFMKIPGDEMVSVFAKSEGYIFDPSDYHWHHYFGYEEATHNFVATKEMAEVIGYYYFVPANSPVPQGSVVIAPDTYILAPAKLDSALSSDPAADLTLALSTVITDPRNLWTSNKLEIAKITFNAGHVDVLLQGEIFGVGDVTLIAARMQILMTIFAHPAVRDARVTFNGDTIANWGISSSMEAKPADYIFNRMEIEAFMEQNPYKAP